MHSEEFWTVLIKNGYDGGTYVAGALKWIKENVGRPVQLNYDGDGWRLTYQVPSGRMKEINYDAKHYKCAVSACQASVIYVLNEYKGKDLTCNS